MSLDTIDEAPVRRQQRANLRAVEAGEKPETATDIAGASNDSVRDYLQRIGKITLLTADDEVALAKQIEIGVLADEKLAREHGLDADLERDLKTLASRGRQAMDRFVQANLRLVVSVAKRYSGHGLPMMDLIQEGNLGLYRAVEKFDYKAGFKFSTYGVWWIKQAINRGQADTTRLIRMPVHQVERLNKLRRVKRELGMRLGREATVEELVEETDFSIAQVRLLSNCDRDVVSLHTIVGDDTNSELGDLIEDDDSPEVIDIVGAGVRHDELHKRVEGLPERERKIVQMRYGLSGRRPMTFEEVGKRLGISRERVRQIESRALKLLRCPELARGA